jgi:hypothetical protein
MKRLSSHLVGISQGEKVLFSDFEDGGPMWTKTGSRLHREHVTFPDAYRSPPVVQVSLAMWDMDQKSNQRADITAENVTAKGFDIVFRTWGDTRVARVRAAWMAIGELHESEEWELY